SRYNRGNDAREARTVFQSMTKAISSTPAPSRYIRPKPMDEPKVITDATIAGATSIDSTRSPLPKNRLKAWSALLMAHARLTDSVNRDLQAAGLPSLSWYDVLFAIYNAPGRRMRQSDLAETVLLSRSGLTRLVDRLETEGMLVREHCAQDLRGVHAVLTGEGLRCLRRIWIVYRGSIQDRFGKHMTSAEADELVAILSRVANRRELNVRVGLSVGADRHLPI
ncbi:MAG TPA: MarR family transcriptional regulator, partial [Bryobacteraceae bacterium]|nr:MarR family transcriptional regulator [Bryobacteraceae bacterium]